MIAAIFDRGRRASGSSRRSPLYCWCFSGPRYSSSGDTWTFNSDQAIVGLMAKHLSEFQTFPLFYYGQNYMLGVQSWIVAPFFWIARPSIGVLKTPLVLLNVLAAVLLMRGISSRLH